mmetsp:Transcript_17902/g.33189  ORF Transcript_17902/g.33189 Transcript_17902/m.33189 type:complete len:141 (-) Transcript_17902:1345-1767(-)
MHPLVRDLYKRAIFVGRDYPLGLDYVRRTWKKALRNPENCPSCYSRRGDDDDKATDAITTSKNDATNWVVIPEPFTPQCEKELRKAVGRGRFMIREMIGVIQLKKYRSMNQRYGDSPLNDTTLAPWISQLQDDNDQKNPD